MFRVLLGVVPALALVGAAVAALVGAAGACGSQITVPDQGVIVTGCHPPGYCFLTTCDCLRASVTPTGACVVASVCTDPNDPSTCNCPAGSLCEESAQACVGRGPACVGRCLPVGSTCSMAGGDPPMLVPTADGGATLESRCAFVDDVCCPASDGGVSPTD